MATTVNMCLRVRPSTLPPIWSRAPVRLALGGKRKIGRGPSACQPHSARTPSREQVRLGGSLKLEGAGHLGGEVTDARYLTAPPLSGRTNPTGRELASHRRAVSAELHDRAGRADGPSDGLHHTPLM